MNGTVFEKRFDSESVCDVSEEFTLPDYIPEVRRIVGVRAVATLDGKYLTGNELEADGGVTYTVLYVSGEGGLCQTSQTSSYTGKIPLKSADDDRFTAADLILSGEAENASCRVTAPRKLTLSSRVRLKMLSQKERDASLKWAGEEAAEIEKVRTKTKKHRVGKMIEVRKNGECSGEIREKEGSRLLFAGGEVCFSDVRITKNRAILTGDGYLTLNLLTPEGEYVTAKSRAAIEEEIPLPDSVGEGNIKSTAFGNVVMLEIETGDDGRIGWNMEYDVDCDLLLCEETEVTEDAYLPHAEEKLTTETLRTTVPCAAVNGRLSVQASGKIAEGHTFVCAWGNGQIEKCEVSGGVCRANGNVVLKYVTVGGGDAVCEEITLPLKYEFDAQTTAADDAEIVRKTAVRVTDITARQDGDSLRFTAELALPILALAEEKIECQTAIAPLPIEAPRERDVMLRVYVPDRDETPWDVEKRFRLGRDVTPTDKSVYII